MLMEVTNVIKILMIEEGYSTEEARKLYWQENPPQGWRRLLPLGLQVPPVNLDGYAAAVLVRRYLKKNKYSIIKAQEIFPVLFSRENIGQRRIKSRQFKMGVEK